MLFSAASCMIGMAIVSGLLQDVSSGNSTRATAGVVFICKPGRDSGAERSLVPSWLQFWMDSYVWSVSSRNTGIREQGKRPGLLGFVPVSVSLYQYLCVTHRHCTTSVEG